MEKQKKKKQKVFVIINLIVIFTKENLPKLSCDHDLSHNYNHKLITWSWVTIISHSWRFK